MAPTLSAASESTIGGPLVRTASPATVCWNAQEPDATHDHLFGGAQRCGTCHLISEGTAQPEILMALYGEVCSSYHAITDFRAKLLALLPISSGAAIFVLLASDQVEENNHWLLPIGIFGCIVTIGLFIYEVEGNRKCVALQGVGATLECALTPAENRIVGQFHSKFRSTFRGPRDPHMFRILHGSGRAIGAGVAAIVIYLAVFGAWAALVVHGCR